MYNMCLIYIYIYIFMYIHTQMRYGISSSGDGLKSAPTRHIRRELGRCRSCRMFHVGWGPESIAHEIA